MQAGIWQPSSYCPCYYYYLYFYSLSTFSFFDLLPSLAWGEYLKGLAGRVEVLQ
ncbi:hypothetical protein DL95DRAFT_381067 [Leptodontidium sp. 2 PMI_412]|nr:hypothetical protein DL95DRAFT_381067 [Leptodontidium sp. 2 PMI_412]